MMFSGLSSLLSSLRYASFPACFHHQQQTPVIKPRLANSNPLDVVVIGAGLGGLAAAIGILQAGHKVTILDKATELREIGAGIQIASNAARVLQKWGILDELIKVSIKPKAFTYHSWTGEPLSVASLNPAYEKELGVPYLLVHRFDLQQLLLRHAKRLGAKIRLASSVASIDFDNATVILEDGQKIHGSLVVGADGGQSISRRLLEGSSWHELVHDSGHDVCRATVLRSTLNREAPDLAGLVTSHDLRAWAGPGAHFVLYPLGNHDEMNIVWIREHAPEQQFIGQPQQLTPHDFHDQFAGWDSRLHKIIDISGMCYKRTLTHVKECRSYVSPSGRFVLIGDAAHPFAPYLAQAGTMAIEDAACLSTLLGDLETKSQLPGTIRLFETLRMPRIREVSRMTEAAGRIWNLHSGQEQQDRDDKMRRGEPGWPNFLSDSAVKNDLYGYDIIEETKKVFGLWKDGVLPAQAEEEANLVPFHDLSMIKSTSHCV